MMEGSVPVIARCVKPAEGKLEIIIGVVRQTQALDLGTRLDCAMPPMLK
jgi:hypothetical protein